MTKSEAQIFTAAILGTQAANNGKKAPCQCLGFSKLLHGRKVGETPNGEATTIKLMKAFNDAMTLQYRKLANIDLLAAGFTKEELGLI